MAELSKEMQMLIEASSMFPGFRFSPTDVELISYYLKKKMEGAEKCVEIIPEVEICGHEPWDLPAKSIIQSDNEWFFFYARGRKYPSGTQSRRATALGYWKATGKERNVKSGSDVIGTKRTLVFHIGRAPKGERTEWLMHEYCIYGESQDSLVVCRLRRNAEFHLNDNANRNSLNRRRVISASGGGIDQTGMSEGDKEAECLRKRSSSYDSHCIEQFDSVSESHQKLSSEAPLAELSCQQQEDSDKEEYFYADILKDDIVELDESYLSAAPELIPSVGCEPDVQTQAQRQRSLEVIMSEALAAFEAPGTSDAEPSGSGNDKNSTDLPSSEEQPKCVAGALSSRIGSQRAVSIIFIVLTLLVLLLSFVGSSKHVKRMTYGTLYKAFRDSVLAKKL